MPPYICLSYATADRREALRLQDMPATFGFRYRLLDEQTDEKVRSQILSGATVLVALTSPAAEAAGSVGADLEWALSRARPTICVSLGENGLDARFCHADSPTPLIQYPMGETPDPQAVGLFVHRLFVRRLCGMDGIFSHYLRERQVAIRNQKRQSNEPVDAGLADDALGERLGEMVELAVRAKAGDSRAAYELGCAYERGDVLPALEHEAAHYIALAAERGVVDALLHMGNLYLLGRGVESNPEEAFRLYSLAAETGDMRGEYALGLCYLRGYGVIKDPIRALKHLSLAARFGYPYALYRMGILCRDGIGTQPNVKAAIGYLYNACLRAEQTTRKTPTDQTADAGKTAAAGKTADADQSATADSPADQAATASQAASAVRETANERLPVSLPSLGCRQGNRRPRCVSLRSKGVVCHTKRLHTGTADSRPSGGRTSGGRTSDGRPRMTRNGYPEDGWVEAALEAAVEARTMLSERERSCREIFGAFSPAAEAALALGRILEEGRAEKGRLTQSLGALSWYRYATRRGSVEALYRLAEMYRCGAGVPADAAEAVKLYRIAANHGNVPARFALAVCLERGIGTAADPTEAFSLYDSAAADGYAPAQNNLGGCYEYGIGVTKNLLTAVEWYARAAGAGQPDAICRLGLCYESGYGVMADPARAFHLFESAAAQNHPYALYRLGVCLNRATYPDLLRHAPDTGSERAALAGTVAEESDRDADGSVVPPRYGRAVELWEKAARAGVADAAYALALAYAGGYGVRVDAAREMAYLHMAAEGGSVQANTRLGYCYMEGRGEVKSAAHAVACFRVAVKLWQKGQIVLSKEGGGLWPIDAVTPTEAAADAYYMLGYCTLYALGEDPSVVEPLLTPSPNRVERAIALLHKAADLRHVGAFLALAEMEDGGASFDAYNERAAAIAEERRQNPSPVCRRRSEPSTADVLRENAAYAFLAMADKERTAADALRADGQSDVADDTYRRAWRKYAVAVEEGSADALVRMAEMTYFGYGTAQDRTVAMRLLKLAASKDGGNVAALMRMGDFYRCGWLGENRMEEADEAYLQALALSRRPATEERYMLESRRQARLAEGQTLRAHVLYRLVTLRSMYFSDDPARNQVFAYLSEAILLGHEEAVRDFSRMYAYESQYNHATAHGDGAGDRPSSLRERLRAQRTRRRLRKKQTRANPPSLFSSVHGGWGANYYTALWPEPRPFADELCSGAIPSEIPEYVRAEVTPEMTMTALNYLGDSFFYGNGMEKNVEAAVTCYRKVITLGRDIRRDQPAALTWAQYSLAWCLLHGHGTEKNAREAIRWLTLASNYHARAAYDLGECYEIGIGVDVPDAREAVKYYRKAYKLGCREAEPKIEAMIQKLGEAAE